MELIQKQKSFQKSVVVEVKENLQKNRFIQQKLGSFAKEIKDLKEEIFKEVVKKLLQKEEQKYIEILGIDAKNIADRLDEPFASLFIEQVESLGQFDRLVVSDEGDIDGKRALGQKFLEMEYSASKLLEELQKIATKVFENVESKKIKKAYEYFKSSYMSHFEIFDSDFLGSKNVDKKQMAIFFLVPLPSNLISLSVLAGSLDILGVYEAEDTSNSWQSVVSNIVRELVAQAKRYGFRKELEDLKEEYKQEIGGVVVELLVQNEILEKDEEETEAKGLTSLRFSKDLLQKAKAFLDRTYTKSIYKPMVMEPIDWKGLEGGGFLHYEGMDERYKVWLMKAETPPERRAVKEIAFPQPILEAINFLQKVSYRINENVLQKYEELIEEFSIPKEYPKLKERLVDLKILLHLKKEFANTGKIEIREKLHQKDIHFFKELFQNRAIRSKERSIKRLKPYLDTFLNHQEDKSYWKKREIEYEMVKFGSSLHTILDIAREFAEYERIYFVWQMDFRGRLYPVQTLLHPQGDGFVKALLEFDTKKVIFDPKWLKIAGASLFGLDKRSYEERIAWFDEHEERVLAVAEGDKWWMEADEPFEFLAFCLDYAEYKKSGKSSFVVSVDGSNNGIQHICAMLRDTKSAINVNVLPTETPKDIYMEVLEDFKKRLNDEIEKFDSQSYEVEEIGAYELYYERLQKQKKKILYKKDFFDRLIEEVEKVEGDLENIWHVAKTEKEKDFLQDLRRIITEDELEQEEIVEEIERRRQRVLKRIENGKYECDKAGNVVKFEVIEEKEYAYASLHRYIIDKVDRSFIKKPVMIDAYGASVHGKAQKIEESLREFLFIDRSLLKSYSFHLAHKVEESINNPKFFIRK